MTRRDADKTIKGEAHADNAYRPVDIHLVSMWADRYVNMVLKEGDKTLRNDTLTVGTAKALRDALIELYPLEAPKTKVSYEVGQKLQRTPFTRFLEDDHYPVIKTSVKEVRENVGFVATREEAQAMVDALNGKQ